MVGADVQGNIPVYRCDKFSQETDIVVGVIQAWNQKIGDLKMHTGTVSGTNGIHYWLELASAIVFIELWLYGFQVDVHRFNPW